MDLTGKIIAVMEPKTGEGSHGPWIVQEYVLEVPGNYPKRMVFNVMGQDRIDRFGIQVGQEVTVYFEIDAHEWNTKWFNEIRAYDVRLATERSAS